MSEIATKQLYTSVHYLESIGNCAIILPFTANEVHSIDCKFSLLEDSTGDDVVIFGSKRAGLSTTFLKRYQQGFLYYGAPTVFSLKLNEPHIVMLRGEKISVDGNEKSCQLTSQDQVAKMALFNTSDKLFPSRSKIWSFKAMRKDGTILCDLIPVIAHNELCMYDIFNDAPYFNVGTGHFVAG